MSVCKREKNINQFWQFSKFWNFGQFLYFIFLFTIFNNLYNILRILNFFEIFEIFVNFYNSTILIKMTKTILANCDNWDTDANSDNWELEFMTIFVTWQLRVTLESIRNSCDVFFIIPILPESSFQPSLSSSVLYPVKRAKRRLWRPKSKHSSLNLTDDDDGSTCWLWPLFIIS